MFHICFCSLLLEKRILLGFLDFYVSMFFVLRILLLEFPVLSHFVFVNSFLSIDIPW